MLDFIMNNWQWLTGILLSLTSILIYLLKRKLKVVDTPLLSTIEYLPTLIKTSESIYGPGEGQLKLSWVLRMALAYYQSLSGVASDSVKDLLIQQIESILDTPQKKE